MTTKQTPKKLRRRYRVLNLDPTLISNTKMPEAFGIGSQWRFTLEEARRLADYSMRNGYMVEIVRVVD